LTDRPSLPGVTLVAVTSVALQATINAIEASMAQANFGKVLLLSDLSPPQGIGPKIRWQPIEPLGSRAAYSRFMLQDLASYIETDHALCIQWDGFVLNGAAWDPQFLEFDYIGAVWPHFDDTHNVGNGGFSLRSQRLLQACRKLPFDGSNAEDVIIGRLCRRELEDQGLRFAPAAVAECFAFERTEPRGDEFGFHGAFNLVRSLDDKASLQLFRSLERGMLARSERAEILRWAIANGRWRLAWHMLFRLM
jgi:hypothetical protein